MITFVMVEAPNRGKKITAEPRPDPVNRSRHGSIEWFERFLVRGETFTR
ncbi:MAG: hypothetical protein ACYTGQ_07625 [Planctomycetota bacterium]